MYIVGRTDGTKVQWSFASIRCISWRASLENGTREGASAGLALEGTLSYHGTAEHSAKLTVSWWMMREVSGSAELPATQL